MALGRPVIASSSGGIRDLLNQGAGLVVQPGSADQLAKALLHWIDAPQEHARIAEAGRLRVAQSHNLEVGQEAMLLAWEQALSAPQR